MVKVRTPAGAREAPLPLRRSRSMPISRPQPSATAKATHGECPKSMARVYVARHSMYVARPSM